MKGMKLARQACPENLSDTLKPRHTLKSLWAQFLPLSMSDITMAFGDPLITMTLAHLPVARINLAAVGVAKAIAVFFESPIIMLLHASTMMAKAERSRKALWNFMLLVAGGLTVLLALTIVPQVFQFVAGDILAVEKDIMEVAKNVLTIMIFWPFAIAWRRYFQGLLIHGGHTRAVAKAGVGRLIFVAVILVTGFLLKINGAILAATALMLGVLAESVIVTYFAKRYNAIHPPSVKESEHLPRNMRGIWRFYWPLAASMLVVWGGRASLVGIIARAHNGPIALAAWPAAWGLVLVIANATRMVQQVIIKNKEDVPSNLLMAFAFSVGGACSLCLLLVGITPVGQSVISTFVGGDVALIQSVRSVVLICTGVPLIVALQNALQGFLIGEGRTHRINVATWTGTLALLAIAFIGVSVGESGAIAASIAMVGALCAEIIILRSGLRDKIGIQFLLESCKTLMSSSRLIGTAAFWRGR